MSGEFFIYSTKQLKEKTGGELVFKHYADSPCGEHAYYSVTLYVGWEAKEVGMALDYAADSKAWVNKSSKDKETIQYLKDLGVDEIEVL